MPIAAVQQRCPAADFASMEPWATMPAFVPHNQTEVDVYPGAGRAAGTAGLPLADQARLLLHSRLTLPSTHAPGAGKYLPLPEWDGQELLSCEWQVGGSAWLRRRRTRLRQAGACSRHSKAGSFNRLSARACACPMWRQHLHRCFLPLPAAAVLGYDAAQGAGAGGDGRGL